MSFATARTARNLALRLGWNEKTIYSILAHNELNLEHVSSSAAPDQIGHVQHMLQLKLYLEGAPMCSLHEAGVHTQEDAQEILRIIEVYESVCEESPSVHPADLAMSAIGLGICVLPPLTSFGMVAMGNPLPATLLAADAISFIVTTLVFAAAKKTSKESKQWELRPKTRAELVSLADGGWADAAFER